VGVRPVHRLNPYNGLANSRMRNQIDFREARRCYVPTAGLDGDVMLEQIARFGAPVNPPPLLVLLGGQSTVHLPRTDQEQLSLILRA
jgi:hypothetical protein